MTSQLLRKALIVGMTAAALSVAACAKKDNTEAAANAGAASADSEAAKSAAAQNAAAVTAQAAADVSKPGDTVSTTAPATGAGATTGTPPGAGAPPAEPAPPPKK